MPTSWLKETFEKGVEELQKLAKTGSIKIDITNLKKKRDERVKLIGNKVLEMIRKGELKANTFEPDYSYILEMDKKIEAKEYELNNQEYVDRDYKPAASSAQPAEAAKEYTALPTPAPVVQKQTEDDDDDKDPHEDYINRPG